MGAIVIIPARAGSRGVPDKNFRYCAGKPLLAWSIEAAMEARPLVERIVVSSDSIMAEVISGEYGVEFLQRPAELATDEAMTDPVLVHALREIEKGASLPEYTVLLQPTVPVRRPGLAVEAIERMVKTGADSLLTGYPLHFVWWREGLTEMDDRGHWRSQCQRRPTRQNMYQRELMWHEDGSVYVTKTAYLLDREQRLGGNIELLETEPTVDIDTEADFLRAEWMLMARAAQAPPVDAEVAPARRRRAAR